MDGENNIQLSLGLSCGRDGMHVDPRGKNVNSPWVDSYDKEGQSDNKRVKRKNPTLRTGHSKLWESEEDREGKMVDFDHSGTKGPASEIASDSTRVPFGGQMSNVMVPPDPPLEAADPFGYSILNLPVLDDTHISNPDSSKQGESENVRVMGYMAAGPVQRAGGDTCDGAAIRAGVGSAVRFGGCGSCPDLPWVSATGPGPNSKTVWGVAYRSREKIGIVCSCHGSHLTPEEFVDHARGEAGADC